MTCDDCQRPFNYCFYINDENWQQAVGKKEGHLCASCILEKLGGSCWWIVWNEPAQRMGDSIGLDGGPAPAHLEKSQ